MACGRRIFRCTRLLSCVIPAVDLLCMCECMPGAGHSWVCGGSQGAGAWCWHWTLHRTTGKDRCAAQPAINSTDGMCAIRCRQQQQQQVQRICAVNAQPLCTASVHQQLGCCLHCYGDRQGWLLLSAPAAHRLCCCAILPCVVLSVSCYSALHCPASCPAARAVTACDFMAVSIEENKQQHAALGNVDFLVADVTEMEQVGRHGGCGCVLRLRSQPLGFRAPALGLARCMADVTEMEQVCGMVFVGGLRFSVQS